ncbi:MAG: tail fiber domain-containing protein [Bacteroidia bacterium]|nr:tail fiber domain-containing protein [Bacteroidia bacterium]
MSLKSRDQLRQIFTDGSIPTQEDFANIFDSYPNHVDDGIRKSSTSALEVQSAGPKKEVIRLYDNFADENPAWSLQLKPSDTQEGLTIADGGGTPRMFVSKANGNVGIGTESPTEKLHVEGKTKITGGLALDGTLSIQNGPQNPQGVIRMSNAAWAPNTMVQVQPAPFRVENAFGIVNYDAGGANAGKSMVMDTAGNVALGGTVPAQRLTLVTAGAALGVDNQATFQAKNAAGAYEHFLWPRWSDNIMYLNYGSSGFHIRNNTSASAMFMKSNLFVGIGTTDPQARLQVAGGAIMPQHGPGDDAGIVFPKNPGGGGGDGAWIKYYVRSGEATTLEIGISNDPDDHIAFMSSGNVGIGTNAPAYKLDVVGTVKASGMVVTNSGEADINYIDTANGQNWQAGTNANGFYIYDNDYRLVVKPGGLVGVGTRNPKALLHAAGDLVLGNGENNKNFIFHSRGNIGDFLQITTDDAAGNWAWGNGIILNRAGFVGIGGGPGHALHVQEGITGWQGRFQNGNSNVYLAHDAGYGIHINTGGNPDGGRYGLEVRNATQQHLLVRDDGFVGIGAGPTLPFHVVKNNPANWQALFNNGPSAVYLAHSAGYGMHINTGVANDASRYALEVRNASQQHLFVRDDGNVGIGTGAPAARLHVVGGTIMPQVGAGDNAGIVFPKDAFGGSGDGAWIKYYTRGGEATTFEIGTSNDADDHIAIMASGNVGIGTNAPAGKLDVRGAIHAGNSDIYFTHTSHNHTGFGNTLGYAAIENAENYGALMILGRSTSNARWVRMYDHVRASASFNTDSDRRLKEDITNLDYGLKEVLALRPVSYKRNDLPGDAVHIGLIAQEVQPILGELVFQGQTEEDDIMSISYQGIIPVLINAIKELKQEIEILKA